MITYIVTGIVITGILIVIAHSFFGDAGYCEEERNYPESEDK